MSQSPEELLDQVLRADPYLADYFNEKEIKSVPRAIQSPWMDSLIIFIMTSLGKVVLKKSPPHSAQADKEVHQLLLNAYPNLYPNILTSSGGVYVMEHVNGRSVDKYVSDSGDAVQAFGLVGQVLSRAYNDAGRFQLRRSLDRQIAYMLSLGPDMDNQRLRSAISNWEDVIADNYPGLPIHNDLNIHNVFLDKEESIKLIDPKPDVLGIKDIAKDIARFLASVSTDMPINWYSLNKLYVSLLTFLESWKVESTEILQRVMFYLAQSFLAFSRWDSNKFTRDQLYNLGIRLLELNPAILTSSTVVLDATCEVMNEIDLDL